jgi:cell division septal protein FtsQ
MESRLRIHPSSKILRQRRKKRLIYLFTILLAAFGLCWGVVAFSRSQMIRITDIKVTGTTAVDPDLVKEIVQQDLSSNYLHFISKNNSFLYPRSKIKADIMSEIRRVKDVSMAVEGNNILNIEISERKPFALWCKPTSESSEQCYFLDSEGFIFAKSPNFYGNVFFRYYDLIDKEDPVGEMYMDASHLKGLQDFARHVSENGLIPVSLHVRSLGEYDLALEKGGTIIFSDRDPFSQTLDNLTTLLADQPGLKDPSNIDYIDLRFGNKLFYKLKNSSILKP